MYYSVILELDKGEAGMLGDGWRFFCVPERVLRELEERRTQCHSQRTITVTSVELDISLLHQVRVSTFFVVNEKTTPCLMNSCTMLKMHLHLTGLDLQAEYFTN